MEACLSAHFASRTLRGMGFEPRIIPTIYVKPFNKGQKNDYNDAKAVAEAALRPNLRTVSEKSQEQLDLQALHRVRSRLVLRRTATINQIRAFLIEEGITVRTALRALNNSFEPILENRRSEISPRMRTILTGLRSDWLQLDERIEAVSSENCGDRPDRGALPSSEDDPGCRAHYLHRPCGGNRERRSIR